MPILLFIFHLLLRPDITDCVGFNNPVTSDWVKRKQESLRTGRLPQWILHAATVNISAQFTYRGLYHLKLDAVKTTLSSFFVR